MADTKKKAAKKATHPKYNEMIAKAITSLNERKGSSRMAILKFICTEFSVSENMNVVNSQLKVSLKKGVADGVLTQVKGSGASGSFKIAKSTKPKDKSKSKAKKATKKVVKPKSVKKTKTKTTTKKPKVKSPKVSKPKPKKAATKAPKKATPKKAKKVAKKATKKPAKK